MSEMNRRAFFSFLSAAPVGVVATVAKASAPTEIDVNRLTFGEFSIEETEDGLRIGNADNHVTVMRKELPNGWPIS